LGQALRSTGMLSSVPGHGLGLAICQSIVLAHGGRMHVSDWPGGSARFSVFLPAQVQPGQFETNYQPKDRRDPATDSAKHSRSGRRAADAQAPVKQPQGQRLRRTVGGGWYGGVETHRGAPVRFGAAVRGIRNELVRACDMYYASKQKAKLAQPWDPASQSCQAAVIPDVAYEPV
jgi:hypothetical protein